MWVLKCVTSCTPFEYGRGPSCTSVEVPDVRVSDMITLLWQSVSRFPRDVWIVKVWGKVGVWMV